VAPQYCGELGKVANCQVVVSLTLARGEVAVPVGLRLFLPAAWTGDPGRCAAAGVPEAARAAQTKPGIALAEIGRGLKAGTALSGVLGGAGQGSACVSRWNASGGDAGYGSGPVFRQGLDGRGLTWAGGQSVYPATVKRPPLSTPTERAAKHPVANRAAHSAAERLDKQPRTASPGNGTQGPLRARFAAVRVGVADGPLNAENTRLPGEDVWLTGEWRDNAAQRTLRQQSAAAGLGAAAGRHCQGALVLRAGAPAAQG
jgi:hypothetical protein